MMLAEPLPFLFHIIHSAASSASAVLVLLMCTAHPQFHFYICVSVHLSACLGWMDGWITLPIKIMYLASQHATVVYTNNT